MFINKKYHAFLTIFIFLSSIVISLVLGEIAARVFYQKPKFTFIRHEKFCLSPNPRLVYELVPYVGCNIHNPCDSCEETNSMGFRGPEYEIKKPMNVYRIVTIGDSLTQALCVPNYKEVFTAIVEAKLNSKVKKPVQVMNFGVSGYNTQQEVETLKVKALRFQPDLVVVAYCLNDIESPFYGIVGPLLEEVKKSPKLNIYQFDRYSLLGHSALFRLMFNLFLNNSIKRKKAEDFEYKKYDTGNTVAENLDRLRKMANEKRFEVLLVVFPRFDEPSFTKYPFYREHEIIKGLALVDHLYYLDLLKSFKNCSQDNPSKVSADAFHPNPLGDACAGDGIASYIINNVKSFRPWNT